MNRIHTGRWLNGGLAAGAFIWLPEGAASALYLEEKLASLQIHRLRMELASWNWIASAMA